MYGHFQSKRTKDIKNIEVWVENFKKRKSQRIIDGLGLIRLFFWFPELCFWATGVMHVVLVQ